MPAWAVEEPSMPSSTSISQRSRVPSSHWMNPGESSYSDFASSSRMRARASSGSWGGGAARIIRRPFPSQAARAWPSSSTSQASWRIRASA